LCALLLWTLLLQTLLTEEAEAEWEAEVEEAVGLASARLELLCAANEGEEDE